MLIPASPRESFSLADSFTTICCRGCTWLSTSHLYKTRLEGQEVTVNKDSKVIILELKEVFRKAGKIFEWKDEYGLHAFGVNRSILRLVDLTKSKLLINFHSDESQKEYWINYDTLRQFVENNRCEFKVSKKEYIINIPVVLFKPKPIFSGAT